MRPVSLTLQGLRSWRTETTIDFDDLSLVAIVGPTGAGKSSLLEALTYALYSATTWDGSAVKDLITMGEHTMTVKLVFRARGGEWTVTRSVSRTSNPPATHLLEGPDEPDGTRNRTDGQQAVTAKVERLLGVDRVGFLRTVVLPQGKFQTLLHAPPGERVALLTGILGLSMLEKVGTLAGETATALTARHEQLLVRRALLPADPVADLAAAEAEVRRLEPLVRSLQDAKAAHRHSLDCANEQRSIAAAAQATARQITTLLAADHRAALAACVAALDGLVGELRAVASEEAALAGQRDPIDSRLAELSGGGLTPGTVAAAVSALGDALALPELHVAQRAARARRDGLAALHAAAIDDAQRAVEELAASADRATDEHECAEGDVEAARDAHARVAGLAESIADLGVRIASRSEEIRSAREALRGAEGDEAAARSRVAEATMVLAAAQEQQRAALRADAVAVIAHDLHAGDDCPVCNRALPPHWTAPPGDAAAAAAAAVEHAETAQARARDAQQGAHARVRSLAGDVEDLAARLKQLTAEREAALAALADPAPDPDDGDAITRVVDAGAARLASAVAGEATAREARGEARDALHDARRTLGALRETHERDRRLAGEDVDRLAERVGELTGRLDRAPATLRPPDTTSVEGVTAALALAERVRGELDDLANAATALDRAARELARRRGDLEAARAAHHPAIEAARSDLRLLHTTVGAGGDDATNALRNADAAALLGIAGRLHDDAAQRIEALTAQERAADAAAEGHAEQAAGILATVAAQQPDLPLATADDLTAAVATRKAEHGSQARACADARAAIPECALLDADAGRVAARRAACQQVRSLTAKTKFPAWLIARREELLLGIASDVLGRLSRDRYGFTNDFKVVDNDAGQARNPKTLSGGETFLASLALAFALVEMTGRSGVRIDCLFLDEGFGSLSTGALDTALGALESQAIGDRLIAVISHVPEVADRVEAVIEISQTADGNSRYRHRTSTLDPRELLALEVLPG